MTNNRTQSKKTSPKFLTGLKDKNIKKMANLNSQAKMFSSKKIIAFDLDGTLTKSKSDIDQEMIDVLCRLLKHKKVVVMGGGNYEQFQNQFINYLKCADRFKNLSILPASGSSLYQFQNNAWKKVYQNVFSAQEKSKILNAFKKAFDDIKYREPKEKYGKVIEDRESQITFSALGQKALHCKKEEWNKKDDVRLELKKALEKYLPEFEVRIGGLTSIDITKKGIDKAYGMKQLFKIFNISKDDVVYIGDAFYEGGNDEAVLKTGVTTISVGSHEETKKIIRNFLNFKIIKK